MKHGQRKQNANVEKVICKDNKDNYSDFLESICKLTDSCVENFKEVKFKVWYNDTGEVISKTEHIPSHVLDEMIEILEDIKRRNES